MVITRVPADSIVSNTRRQKTQYMLIIIALHAPQQIKMWKSSRTHWSPLTPGIFKCFKIMNNNLETWNCEQKPKPAEQT